MVLNPAGERIAEADVDRIDRSRGAAGVRIVMREVNGVFDRVLRVNVTDLANTASFTLLPLEGRPIAAIRGVIHFLATLADLIGLLSHLQDHADAVIKVPDFDANVRDQHRESCSLGGLSCSVRQIVRR